MTVSELIAKLEAINRGRDQDLPVLTTSVNGSFEVEAVTIKKLVPTGDGTFVDPAKWPEDIEPAEVVVIE